MGEDRAIRVRCPKCEGQSTVNIPVDEFESLKSKGIVTIAALLGCGHACQLFVDSKFKFRGGQAADLILDTTHIGKVNGKEQNLNASLDDDEDENADLLRKLASEIYILDAKEYLAIKTINAEERVDIAELSLLTGDTDAAKIIFSDLADFCDEIGEDYFAESLRDRIKRIDLLDTSDADFKEVLQDLEHEMTAEERQSERKKQLNRLDDLLVDLKFSNMKGEISNSEYEYKRARLLELKLKL